MDTEYYKKFCSKQLSKLKKLKKKIDSDNPFDIKISNYKFNTSLDHKIIEIVPTVYLPVFNKSYNIMQCKQECYIQIPIQYYSLYISLIDECNMP